MRIPEATFPQSRIIQVFEQLAEEDLGYVMQRYLQAITTSLREHPVERCNSVGLYLLMVDTLKILSNRFEKDAVQHAIPSFLRKLVTDSQNDFERHQAKDFVKGIDDFINLLGTSVHAMTQN